MRYSWYRLHRAIAQGSLSQAGVICWVCGSSPPVRPEADHFVPLAKPGGPIFPVCRRCNRNRPSVLPTGEQEYRLENGKLSGTCSGREAIVFAKRWAKRVYGSELLWKLSVADTGAERGLFRSVDGVNVKCMRSTSLARSGREKAGLLRK